jgi:hypothetical protein
MIYDQSLKAIEEREARIHKPMDTIKTLKPMTTTATATTSAMLTPYPHTNAFLKPIYQNPLCQQLSNEGKCFICQEQGHRISECPHYTELKAIKQA